MLHHSAWKHDDRQATKNYTTQPTISNIHMSLTVFNVSINVFFVSTCTKPQKYSQYGVHKPTGAIIKKVFIIRPLYGHMKHGTWWAGMSEYH